MGSFMFALLNKLLIIWVINKGENVYGNYGGKRIAYLFVMSKPEGKNLH
jgi:hypothetical protein